MKFAGSVLEFFLKANFFIAIVAAALFYGYDIYFNNDFHVDPIEFVFFSTLLTYNGLRLIPYFLDKSYNKENDPWLHKNKNALIGICIFSFGAIVTVLFSLEFTVVLYLLHVGLVSLFYSFPFALRKFRNLRAVPFLKIFVISYVWMAVSTGLPLFLEGKLSWDRWPEMLECFLFIFAITLPFDIRDYKWDYKKGIKTIPGLVGVSWTKILGVVLLLVGLFLVESMVIPYAAIFLLSGILIIFSNRTGSYWYYLGLIDGLILIKSIVLIIYS